MLRDFTQQQIARRSNLRKIVLTNARRNIERPERLEAIRGGCERVPERLDEQLIRRDRLIGRLDMPLLRQARRPVDQWIEHPHESTDRRVFCAIEVGIGDIPRLVRDAAQNHLLALPEISRIESAEISDARVPERGSWSGRALR